MRDARWQQLYDLYSDLYKEANGIRPRWAATWDVTRLEAAVTGMTERDEHGLGMIPTQWDNWAFVPASDPA